MTSSRSFCALSRTRCFRWIQFLLPVLATTLGRYLVFLSVDPLGRRVLRGVPGGKDIFIDGTGAEFRTVSDQKRRKATPGKRRQPHGKPWSYPMTSEFLSSPRQIRRRHDKRLFDKAMGGRNIPPSVTAWTDTGFRGLQRDHQHTIMPMKATKYHRLTEEEKTDNRLISGIRVISEHAIAGIKRSSQLPMFTETE